MQSDPATAITAQITATGIGSIVYIGCGLASDLDAYRGLSPERIYLVEPNPDLTADLQEIANADPLVTFLPLAITAPHDNRQFNILNYFDLSSLATPTTLTYVFPGAVVEQVVQVTTVTLGTLIERITLSKELPNLLVIETPGCESSIIAALTGTGFAAHFSVVIAGLPVQPLFDGSLTPDNFTANMLQAGYTAVMTDINSNADWARSIFTYNPALANLHTRESTLQAYQNKIAELTADLAALRAAEADRLSVHQAENAMALRLQTLRDNDMRDLQERFQEAERDREQLENLLKSITVQLRAASHYVTLLESDADAHRISEAGSGQQNCTINSDQS